MSEIPIFHDPFLDAADPGLVAAIRGARAGRVNLAEARKLYTDASLPTLGALANSKKRELHPGNIITYVGDRNINYSNVCVCQCRFCAFYKSPGDPGAYVISREEMADKINETIRLGGTQILLQGGHHPDLPLEWYESLLAWMRQNWPKLHIHAFSPPEIFFWSKKTGLPVRGIIQRLQRAGLDSIPGGGAEILHDDIRKKVSPNKCSASAWLDVMETAHSLGMKTTATMMFGHEEDMDHRLAHLFAMRDLQDRTGGFTAFIPWTFQPGNTRIQVDPLPAPAYLRLLAISRIVLDNIPNIQASWVTMGPEIAQLALFYGANDFGSLMIEENVVAAAGVSYKMSRDDINAVIRAAGFIPRQRYMDYTLLEEEETL